MQLFGNPNAYCHIDQSGLIAWNDSDFLLKDILSNKKRMPNKNATYEWICEIIKRRLDAQEANDPSVMELDETNWNLFD